jgi:hypothetical protein
MEHDVTLMTHILHMLYCNKVENSELYKESNNVDTRLRP